MPHFSRSINKSKTNNPDDTTLMLINLKFLSKPASTITILKRLKKKKPSIFLQLHIKRIRQNEFQNACSSGSRISRSIDHILHFFDLRAFPQSDSNVRCPDVRNSVKTTSRRILSAPIACVNFRHHFRRSSTPRERLLILSPPPPHPLSTVDLFPRERGRQEGVTKPHLPHIFLGDGAR